ncbi:hypothetical protein [Fulvimarina endophytica]|uniref:hypothetical protein n=1 Tax=Fulvimarina endophytica TaxID=2293836 RepID=UPI0011C06EC9|nr:hypothetical protein [Fulvimarina endophytica]
MKTPLVSIYEHTNSCSSALGRQRTVLTEVPSAAEGSHKIVLGYGVELPDVKWQALSDAFPMADSVWGNQIPLSISPAPISGLTPFRTIGSLMNLDVCRRIFKVGRFSNSLMRHTT